LKNYRKFRNNKTTQISYNKMKFFQTLILGMMVIIMNLNKENQLLLKILKKFNKKKLSQIK